MRCPTIRSSSTLLRFSPLILGFLGLILASGGLLAQIDPVKAAEEEALRRQETILVLKQNLAKAQGLENEGEYAAASTLYEECTRLVDSLGGVNVQAEYRAAIVGLTNSRYALSKAHFEQRRFPEAVNEMDQLLKFDPKSSTGASYKNYINQTADKTEGRTASEEMLDKVPAYLANKKEVAGMIQDGKFLYEMRLLDEAKKKLRLAIEMDPAAKAAYYYLSLIQEAEYGDEARKRDAMQKERLVEVERSWNEGLPLKSEILPTPNPYFRTNNVNTSSRRRQVILRKLNSIVLDELLFDDLPLGEVVRFLDEEVRKKDPDGKGINFIINPFMDDLPSNSGISGAGATGGFDDGGEGGGEGDIFGADAAGAPPLLDAFGQPIGDAAGAGPADAIDLENVVVSIDPALNDMILIDALDAISKTADLPIKYIVEDYAIVFTQKTPDTPQLFTRVFKVDPNTFFQGLQNVTGIDITSLSGGAGGQGGGQGGGGQGGGGGGGGGGGQGGGGQGGGQGGGGGGFLIPTVSVTGGGGGGQGGGQGGGGGGGGQGGGGAGGGGIRFVTQTNSVSEVANLVRGFFAASGVNLDAGSGTQVFFNDRNGVLMIRASIQDLEIIQNAIEILSLSPPMVTIEAKFAEVTQQDNRGIGFDWFLGNAILGNGLIGSGGTQPSFAGQPSQANPLGTFPGVPGVIGQQQQGGGGGGGQQQNSLGTLSPPTESDGNFSTGLRNQVGIGGLQGSMPTVASLTGILTDPQFKVVVHALENRDGVDILSAPRVTTLSGRQAQVAVIDLASIPTGGGAQTQGAGGGGNGNGGQGGGGALAASVNFGVSAVPLGPTLDVLPYVSADGFSVQMTLIPNLTEFIGFDDPGPFVPQAQSVAAGVAGVPLTSVLALPRFRVRSVVTSAIIWDGQTIVLGGLISEDVRNIKDKIPVLGDLPLMGRLFRSESKSTSKKNLIIFVTPTIVDPAGNRVNTDEELPFGMNPIPPQPAWLEADRNYRAGW